MKRYRVRSHRNGTSRPDHFMPLPYDEGAALRGHLFEGPHLDEPGWVKFRLVEEDDPPEEPVLPEWVRDLPPVPDPDPPRRRAASPPTLGVAVSYAAGKR